jgi:triosephosphate isomerase
MVGTTRRPLIAGNWKMNGSLDMAERLASEIARGAQRGTAEIAVMPPFPYLETVRRAIRASDVALGAQDVSERPGGAFTGDVAGSMLVDCGAKYVLVGHSERRQLHAETDATIAAKFRAALKAGLIPILCVGETREQREGDATVAVVGDQVDAVVRDSGIAALAGGVIAYEPVWAIGTGLVATPEQAQQVHAFIRSRLSEADATIGGQIRIVYGGSMKPGNARELLACEDIDGGLIGGAALQSAEFLDIVGAAA